MRTRRTLLTLAAGLLIISTVIAPSVALADVLIDPAPGPVQSVPETRSVAAGPIAYQIEAPLGEVLSF